MREKIKPIKTQNLFKDSMLFKRERKRLNGVF